VHDVGLGDAAFLRELGCGVQALDRRFRAAETELEQAEGRLHIQSPELVAVVFAEGVSALRLVAATRLVTRGRGQPSEALMNVGAEYGLGDRVVKLGRLFKLGASDGPPSPAEFELGGAAERHDQRRRCAAPARGARRASARKQLEGLVVALELKQPLCRHAHELTALGQGIREVQRRH
jgi:hypothetical protein